MLAKLIRNPVSLCAAIVVALSTLGLILSVQQYFLTLGHEETTKVQAVLDESFQVLIESTANAERAVAVSAISTESKAHFGRSKEVQDAATVLLNQVKGRQLIDIAIWGAVFALSAGILLMARSEVRTS